MFSRYVLPSLAAVGVLFAVSRIASGSRPAAVAEPVAQPARAPFERFIAGAGIVEPSSRNIAVGTPLSRVVTEVLVRPGQDVAANAPLFQLDDRDLRAELAVRQSALASASANLARYQALPRPEDLPPARARVAEAEAKLADADNRLRLVESIEDPRAISIEEVERRRHEREASVARLDQARGELELLQAGAWEADLSIARAQVGAAESEVAALEVELARLTVRAPVAGRILQVNVRAGEFASAGTAGAPLILMGQVEPLHVRVDIDENDAWRFQEGAAATASVRGNRDIKTELQYEYLEPYVVPKTSLTGDATERVDTRVLQIVFSFERGRLPIQVGQQMDVFIAVEDAPRAGQAEGGLQ